jgi:hypothetical protein
MQVSRGSRHAHAKQAHTGDEDADFNALEQDRQECCQPEAGILPVELEEPEEVADVHQVGQRHHHDGGEAVLGQVEEEG